jgi:FkbM family methyltransferase
MKTRRFDAWEMAIVGSVLMLGTFVITNSLERPARLLGAQGAAEVERFRRQYGPERHSRNAEEWLIRDFFQDEREGVFVDVGANHYRDESNTYYLETVLGWGGVAVDALAEFAADYARHRPRTRFHALFVSDVSDAHAELFVPESNHLVASSDPAFVARETGETAPEARQIPTITLNDLLAREGLERIDFLSMDIEQAEPQALAGFDIERYRPRLVCIEGHRPVRQQILDYFHRHGYVLVGKYLRADSLNLYFTPASLTGTPG